MKISALIVVFLSSTALAQEGAIEAADAPAAPAASLSPSTGAMVAATADGVSTLMGAASGALTEANPLMPSSPGGIVLMTAAKIGMGYYADRMDPETRESSLKTMTATYGGAAINNLMLLASIDPGVAAAAGLLSGLYFWFNTDRRLAEERQVTVPDVVVAFSSAKAVPTPPAEPELREY